MMSPVPRAQMTMAQFEKTMLDVRRTCGAKMKVSDELIDGNKNLIISRSLSASLAAACSQV